ncbi:MAG: glycoside hydrolase family 27 protein [Vicinamibacteria bacterium]
MRPPQFTAVLIIALALLSSDDLGAQPKSAAPIASSLAPTPPMGFNTWNKFGCNVSEPLIRETADAMAANGMREAGYRYVVIDDCWQVSRDESGKIVADPKRFPSGLRALADYVHGKGLKFGLYTDLGTGTCEGRPGSRDHHDIDARTYAEWQIDYIKVDWCHADDLDARTQYTMFRDALRKTARPIVLSICEWGRNRPWEWASTVGQLWRTTSDISDNWNSVVWILNANDAHASVAGRGHWNDPDMLEVGNGGMTAEEYRSHFSMWAIMAAPLITGNDLRSMTEDTKSILLNEEVIAVDQDPLGVQGRKVLDRGYGSQVWVKPLADGSRAIAVLNLAEKEAELYVRWSDIGISPGRATVRDLWAHRDLEAHTDTGRNFDERLVVKVPAHGVALLRVKPIVAGR